MKPRIVHARPEYAPPPFGRPTSSGYLYFGATVAPARKRAPVPRNGTRKDALLGRLKVLAAELERQGAVRRAGVYRAVMVPPGRPGGYDVSVLVETGSPDGLDEVRAGDQYRRMAAEIAGAATDVYEMSARCLRFLGDPDARDDGLFLFNHFTADEPQVATRVWEYLAGWYVTEMGLDNSCLLEPQHSSKYVFVNYARWDMNLPAFALRQASRKTFRRFVGGNMAANGMTASPILYRKA